MNEVPAHRLKAAKRALRRELLARRDAMPASARAAASRAIADRAIALPEVRGAGVALVFWSFGSEVDTAPLMERLRAAGGAIALPRIEGGEVVAVRLEPGGEVRPTAFGAMEPVGTPLAPGAIDVVIAPGVAFDRAGNRLGYGGGYYDRFLRRLIAGPPTIAVAFDLQVVEAVPAGHGDLRVDAIVTEREVIRCRVG